MNEPKPLVACQQFGRCCHMLVSTASLDITEEDLTRWEAQGREDILEWVSILTTPTGEIMAADFPVGPGGEDVDQCPFLEKRGTHSVCRVHDTKPTECAEFHCVTRRWSEGAAYQLSALVLWALSYGLRQIACRPFGRSYRALSAKKGIALRRRRFMLSNP